MNNQVQQQAPAPQVITKSTILYSERRGATYKPNDEIEIKEKSRTIPIVIDSVQKLIRDVPEYLKLNQKEFKTSYVRFPSSDEIPYATQMLPAAVIEYYSR